VVGTILPVVNQGSVVLGGDASWQTWIRVGVNYLTPYVVASIGFLAGCRVERGTDRSGREASLSLSGFQDVTGAYRWQSAIGHARQDDRM